MTTTCTYHCGRCGLHFHSLKAFDAHRQGDHAKPAGSEEGRHCVHPLDMDGRLVVLTENGTCRIRPPERGGGTPVTVWTYGGDMDRIRAHHGRTAL